MAKQLSLPWPWFEYKDPRWICQDAGCDKTAREHWGALYLCGYHFDERVKKYGF